MGEFLMNMITCNNGEETSDNIDSDDSGKRNGMAGCFGKKKKLNHRMTQKQRNQYFIEMRDQVRQGIRVNDIDLESEAGIQSGEESGDYLDEEELALQNFKDANNAKNNIYSPRTRNAINEDLPQNEKDTNSVRPIIIEQSEWSYFSEEGPSFSEESSYGHDSQRINKDVNDGQQPSLKKQKKAQKDAKVEKKHKIKKDKEPSIVIKKTSSSKTVKFHDDKGKKEEKKVEEKEEMKVEVKEEMKEEVKEEKKEDEKQEQLSEPKSFRESKSSPQSSGSSSSSSDSQSSVKVKSSQKN